MPKRSNIVGDLGTTKVASDSYDVDNIYLTEEGWVYRHYKKSDKSKWWDEIIVAGEVVAADNAPCEATNPPKLGTVAAPTFESGDSLVDFEASPLYGNELTGGGVPNLGAGGDGGAGGGNGELQRPRPGSANGVTPFAVRAAVCRCVRRRSRREVAQAASAELSAGVVVLQCQPRLAQSATELATHFRACTYARDCAEL